MMDCHVREDAAGLSWALRPCTTPSKGSTTELHPHWLVLIWAWCATPVNPALRRLRQEGHEFKASQGVTHVYMLVCAYMCVEARDLGCVTSSVPLHLGFCFLLYTYFI